MSAVNINKTNFQEEVTTLTNLFCWTSGLRGALHAVWLFPS